MARSSIAEPALYDFREASEADLSVLSGWLAAPHVARWWDEDPRKSLAAIRQAMDSDDTEPLIVELDGRPIAYLQSYDPHLEDDHPYQDQPFGTLSIDIFIGPEELIGKNHGPEIVRQFAELLFEEGAPRVIIDPHPDNHRAIRAFEKAGFRITDRRTTIHGPAVILALDTAEDE